MVIGPTPRGTGVISEATSSAPGSTSPTMPRLGAVDAHVDNDAAGLHHLRGHHRGAPDRDDENVGGEGVGGEILGARVADRHGRVLLQEQVRDRLADDRAAADHDRARAGRARRRARGAAPSRRAAWRERASGGRGRARRRSPDGSRRRPSSERRRGSPSPRRCAPAAAAARASRRRRVGVQRGDPGEQVGLGDVGRQPQVGGVDPGVERGLVLEADVDLRGGVVAHEHRHEPDVAERAARPRPPRP